MVFDPAVPQPADFLSDSQGDILNNFGSSDTSFGVNHYAFSNGTANNGKHNVVQTPIITPNTHPTTAADEPKFYAYKENQGGASPPVGTIQWSRGPSNAQPSPVTILQSPVAALTLAANTTTDVLDFSGFLKNGFGTLFAVDSVLNSRLIAHVIWSGSAMTITTVANSNLTAVNSTSKLQIKCGAVAVNNLYWSFQLYRVQI